MILSKLRSLWRPSNRVSPPNPKDDNLTSMNDKPPVNPEATNYEVPEMLSYEFVHSLVFSNIESFVAHRVNLIKEALLKTDPSDAKTIMILQARAGAMKMLVSHIKSQSILYERKQAEKEASKLPVQYDGNLVDSIPNI